MTKEKHGPLLIHQESGVIIRSIRDHLREDINEIVVDDPDVFAKTRDYVRSLRPDYVNRVKLYRDTVPLFNRFQVENTIETAFQRAVKLPSGGSIVIDRTEALVSIDINSARATRGGDIEETAFNTNLEAAEEISRQLRLRDLAGLIVIDFIDMSSTNHQRDVEKRLREALQDDRARVQIGRISRFGLLEMSRQRLGPSLAEAIEDVCPTCHGHGTIRGVASLSLAILRSLEEEAIKDNTGQVQAQLPVEVATYLLNEKRKHIAQIEQRHNVEIVIIPNQYLQRPHYDIKRLRQDELTEQMNVSYKLIRLPGAELAEEETTIERRAEPLLKTLRDGDQRPPSIIKRIFGSLFGDQKAEPAAATSPVAEALQQPATVDRRNSRGTGDRSRNPRQQRRGQGDRDQRDNRDNKPQGDKDRRPRRQSDSGREEGNKVPQQETSNIPQTYTKTNNPELQKAAEAAEAAALAAVSSSVANEINEPTVAIMEDFKEGHTEINTEQSFYNHEAADQVKHEPVTTQVIVEQTESLKEVTTNPLLDIEALSLTAEPTETIVDEANVAVDEEPVVTAETQQQQHRRRQQRPYRGPGRRRTRDNQQRRPQKQHQSPEDMDSGSH